MTNNKYNKYQGLSITKELLDSIEIGDLIKINDWGKPLRVKCVSKNYVALAIKLFNKNIYSIIEKKMRIQGNHNEMQKGKFHVGPDNMIFGDLNFDYLFNNCLLDNIIRELGLNIDISCYVILFRLPLHNV